MSVFLGCGLGDLLCGQTAMVTGIEDEGDGALRVYVGARYKGVYVLVDGQEAQGALRDAWATGDKVLIPLPPRGRLSVER
jgi:hypothetical protein